MEHIEKSRIQTLSNAGVSSQQLLCPGNSASDRVTITRVTVEPGAIQPRHKHRCSEQIWIALQGECLVLLNDMQAFSIQAGDVVRFDADEIHGLQNTGGEMFTYITVTSPPLDFRSAYRD